MRLMVLSAVHGIARGRRNVYTFFCKRMETIRKETGVEMLVVGSEGDESRLITEKYGHHYLEHPNRPVSDKWNAGMVAIREYNPTHVMILGSDDFISTSLIKKYLEIASSGEYHIFGITDSYYLGLNEGAMKFGVCGYWGGYPHGQIIGYARVFNDEILDLLEWHPWAAGINAGLDFSVNKKLKNSMIAPRELPLSIKKEEWLHIDIKTRGNISSMSPLKLEEVDYKELFAKHLPEDEGTALTKHVTDFIEGIKKASKPW